MKPIATKTILEEPTETQKEFIVSYDTEAELTPDSQREINRILNHVFNLKLTPTKHFDNRMEWFKQLQKKYTPKKKATKKKA